MHVLYHHYQDCGADDGSYPYQRNIKINNQPIWFCSSHQPIINTGQESGIIMVSKNPTHTYLGKQYHDISFHEKPYFPRDDYIATWTTISILSNIIFMIIACIGICDMINMIDTINKNYAVMIRDYNIALIITNKNIHDINLVAFTMFALKNLHFDPYEGNIIFEIQVAFFFWLFTASFKIMLWITLFISSYKSWIIDIPIIGNFVVFDNNYANMHNIFYNYSFPIYFMIQYIPQIICASIYIEHYDKDISIALTSLVTSVACIVMFVIFVVKSNTDLNKEEKDKEIEIGPV